METAQPSPAHTSIAIEAESRLSTRAELALIRTAYRRRSSSTMRWKLANLMSRMADWDGLIELLAPLSDLSIEEDLLLATALLDRRSIECNGKAMQSIDRVYSGASTETQRSAALVLRARIEASNRDRHAARATLQQALALDPANRGACMRLARIEFGEGLAGAAAIMVDGLAARGIEHPYILAVRALSQACRGDMTGARQTMGTDLLCGSGMIAPPPGWNDITAFNEALADELLAHPDLRYQRYGASPSLSWGIDAPFTPAAPLLGLLLDSIAVACVEHITVLGKVDHPWLRIRPAKATLHCSCAMTEADDFEGWHVHPTGWLNGVYYVQIPEAASDDEEAGCLAFGLPDGLVGNEAAKSYGRQIIRPRSGLLVTFPSHTYHRTFAHGCEGRRIAVTFELRPS
jgi:hypothetical protein